MCKDRNHDASQSKDRGEQLTRRKLMQAAAWATGGGLLAGRIVDPETALADSAMDAASLLTRDRIAYTPTFKYRPYRSRPAKSPDTVSWLQIDLGESVRIDAVRLFPANERLVPGKDEYYPGEGFPECFRLETAEDAAFQKPATLAEFSRVPFSNPKDSIVSIPGIKQKARYLRLTVTRMPAPACGALNPDAAEANPICSEEGRYWFALSRIAVIAGGKELSLGRPVVCDEIFGNKSDARQITRQERIETEYVHRDRPERVTPRSAWKPVPYKAQVPVTGVTLRGGLFESTMRNNIGYLLGSYTVDDLLLQFRERAGKPVPPLSRKVDQFWESDLAGSNAGRFLMGACNTLRWMDDPELRNRVEAVVDGIAECRQPNGHVMAYPEDSVFYSERGAYTRAWLTHGLIEAGIGGNKKAFEMLRGNYDLFNSEKFLPELMRAGVQGGQGMIANTRMYFTPVGKPEDIQLIQRYYLEDRWLAELAKYNQDQIWQYPYDRPHCYLLTNLEAYMDVYRATGDEAVGKGVKAGWEMYKKHWVQQGGSISIIEFLSSPPDSQSLTLKLGEFCGNAFWAFLSQRFQMIDPDEERYAAEIEQSIYNVAIANQKGTYGLRYHVLLVGNKEKATRNNTCCEGQGTRLIGSLPEHIYSIAADGLYVNLFEPSAIEWKQDGVPMKLTMETRFPFSCHVKLAVTTPLPKPAKLRVRVPGWAANDLSVSVNGMAAGAGKPGTFLTLDREWSNGDVVSFTLPADFTLTEYTGADQIPGHKRYSLAWGPFLYAAVGSKDAVIRLPGPSVKNIAASLTPKPESPLHFSVAGNPDVVFVPYWQVDEEEFTCFPAIEVG